MEESSRIFSLSK
jgi:hypothetical protein